MERSHFFHKHSCIPSDMHSSVFAPKDTWVQLSITVDSHAGSTQLPLVAAPIPTCLVLHHGPDANNSVWCTALGQFQDHHSSPSSGRGSLKMMTHHDHAMALCAAQGKGPTKWVGCCCNNNKMVNAKHLSKQVTS